MTVLLLEKITLLIVLDKIIAITSHCSCAIISVGSIIVTKAQKEYELVNYCSLQI